MKIQEATIIRIQQLRKQKNLSVYALIYFSGMPPSTVKSILHHKSRNPGIVNIQRIIEGLGITTREFYDSELFDNLDPED